MKVKGFGPTRGSRTYTSWIAMKQRCLNPSTPCYPRYGGRGITICEEWINSFPQFLKDMGLRPPKTSIDRKNNDLGYTPENCKWSNRHEQATNSNPGAKPDFITYNGITLTVLGWAMKLNLDRSTIYRRIRSGWTMEEALDEKSFQGSHKWEAKQ